MLKIIYLIKKSRAYTYKLNRDSVLVPFKNKLQSYKYMINHNLHSQDFDNLAIKSSR